LHENIKARKSTEYSSLKASVRHNVPQKLVEKTLLSPLANNSLVKHKLYGMGAVISTDEYGYMSVAFASKVAKFIYPDAFKNGFLARA
jgi:hypothetical protein